MVGYRIEVNLVPSELWSFFICPEGGLEMITVYTSTDKGLEVVEQPKKGCWIHLVDPSVEELQEVALKIKVDLQMLKFSLDQEAIPRAEKADSSLRITARIPYRQRSNAQIPYITIPVGIILAEDWGLTVSRQKSDFAKDLENSPLGDLTTSNPRRFVMHLLWSIANSYLRYLSEINETVEKLENRLQQSLQNQEVLGLLRFQKSLVYFTTALETMHLMIERLQRAEMMDLKPGDLDLLDDVITENQEAMKMTEIAGDMLGQTMDAYTSIISNNLNVVMKFLTSITVILIIPQIFGTFYGMNVMLPAEDHPYAFVMIVGLAAGAAAVVGYIFRRKKWL